MSSAIAIKDEVHKLAEQLPAQATWDDVIKEAEFRRAVQKGIEDAEAGRVTPHEDVKRKWEAKLAAKLDR